MKTSAFNITSENPDSGEVVLFNSLYGSLSVWSRFEFELTKQIFDRPDSPSASGAAQLIKKQLRRLKYIVANSVDEMAIIRNRKTQGIKDCNRLDVTILPNMTCNFACPYCYETHLPSSFMSDDTEEAIKAWLQNEIPKFKVLLLNWFGGEPLLNYKRVVSIGAFARDCCNNSGVGLLTNLTTNGYLLNKAHIKELVKIGILSYQITMDGSPNLHNKTRILKNGKGSFDRVFENICLLVREDERVRVSLRVNFNQNNLYDIPNLLKLFPTDTRSHLRVVYEPIFGKVCLSATENIPSLEISRRTTEYYSLARDLGYDVRLGGINTGRLVYCYAERENQFVVNYNGDIYKCTSCSFDPEQRLGYLNRDGKIAWQMEELEKWSGLEMFDARCNTCKFLPICMGGCRKTRVENAGTGSFCSLMPTNTSFLLKTVAYGEFRELLLKTDTDDQGIDLTDINPIES